MQSRLGSSIHFSATLQQKLGLHVSAATSRTRHNKAREQAAYLLRLIGAVINIYYLHVLLMTLQENSSDRTTPGLL